MLVILKLFWSLLTFVSIIFAMKYIAYYTIRKNAWKVLLIRMEIRLTEILLKLKKFFFYFYFVGKNALLNYFNDIFEFFNNLKLRDEILNRNLLQRILFDPESKRAWIQLNGSILLSAVNILIATLLYCGIFFLGFYIWNNYSFFLEQINIYINTLQQSFFYLNSMDSMEEFSKSNEIDVLKLIENEEKVQNLEPFESEEKNFFKKKVVYKNHSYLQYSIISISIGLGLLACYTMLYIN